MRKVTAPGYIIYSASDLLVDHVFDIPRLYDALANCRGKLLVPVPAFNHLDFAIGKSAPNIVYSAVINFFHSILKMNKNI